MSTRFITRTAAVILALLLAACTEDTAAPNPEAAVVPLPAPGAATLEWQEQTRGLVMANRLSPLAAGRVYAAVSVAQRRAIDDLEALPQTAVQAGVQASVVPDGRAQLEARRGAVAGASVRVLSFLFPAAADALEQKLIEQGGEGPGNVHPHFGRGVDFGRLAGDAIVAHLQSDGFTAPWTGTAPTGPGLFTPVALPPAGVLLGNVRPYFLNSGSQFRPAPPPAFGSAAFNTDLTEVVTRSLNRTALELALVHYWDQAAPSPTAIGLWNGTAAAYVSENSLDELDATRVFALMHATIFDAMIGCWDAKYHYWFIRPSQAATVALAIPMPNHPSYPSGHSCVSASAATVLTHFFPEHTEELSQMVTDAGFSRIVAGIHYRFDVTAGQGLGRAVADWALTHNDF